MSLRQSQQRGQTRTARERERGQKQTQANVEEAVRNRKWHVIRWITSLRACSNKKRLKNSRNLGRHMNTNRSSCLNELRARKEKHDKSVIDEWGYMKKGRRIGEQCERRTISSRSGPCLCRFRFGTHGFGLTRERCIEQGCGNIAARRGLTWFHKGLVLRNRRGRRRNVRQWQKFITKCTAIISLLNQFVILFNVHHKRIVDRGRDNKEDRWRESRSDEEDNDKEDDEQNAKAEASGSGKIPALMSLSVSSHDANCVSHSHCAKKSAADEAAAKRSWSCAADLSSFINLQDLEDKEEQSMKEMMRSNRLHAFTGKEKDA